MQQYRNHPPFLDRVCVTSSLQDQLRRRFLTAWPATRWAETTIVVAVSGGADSVGLLRLLLDCRARAETQLVVAHFNHRLRGPDSDLDEQFVRLLANQWRLPLDCAEHQPTPAAGDSIIKNRNHDTHHGGEPNPSPHPNPQPLRRTGEAALREERYAFLLAAAHRRGARYVLTAHTADDQAETILHRVMRGTGVRGLAGIPPARRLSELTTLVRPLLGIRRATIRDYLRELEQPWREDASNADPRYLRNRIRHELIPLLTRDYQANAVQAVCRLGAAARATATIVDREAQRLLADAIVPAAGVERSAGSIALDCAVLARQGPALARETIRLAWRREGWPLDGMTMRDWQQLAAWVCGDDSRRAARPKDRRRDEGDSESRESRSHAVLARTFPGGIEARCEWGQLLLRPVLPCQS